LRAQRKKKEHKEENIMNDITTPLHPKSTLIKALVAAVVIATTLYFTVILPAEYNIDPTGVGKLLGLTVLTQETAPDTQTAPAAPTTGAIITNTSANEALKNVTTITVPPQRGIEYKFNMAQYSQMTYEWSTASEPLYFDFHGEPKGDTTGYYLSYTIATANKASGTVTVPFDGIHGWYWKNTTDNAVVVTLKTTGDFAVVDMK
jgi:hypothetical protein